MNIPTPLFVAIAESVIPRMKEAMVEMELPSDSVEMTIAMTGTVPIDGVDTRVRLTVTLDPDEDDEDEDQ